MKLKITKPFHIVTGSHIHNLSGTGYKLLAVGEIVDVRDTMDPESSNVWITTSDGERGKLECGTWRNLLDGRAVEMPLRTP